MGNRIGLGGVGSLERSSRVRIEGGRDLDEQELVRRARDGDLDAYESLVRAYQSAALRLAVSLGPHLGSEDAVQSAFVKAFHALDRFRDGSAFRPWLLRIVANEMRNRHRAERRRLLRDTRWASRPSPPPPEPETVLLAKERDRELWTALDRLREQDRAVLVCRYLLELSVEETAAVLGCPTGTVKSRQARAVRRLESLLEDEGVIV